MADLDKASVLDQRPAILIGLGGTGKQVLLNLRRMFYESIGRVSVPYVGHLWIDTDTSNITLDGKEMDFLMREVDFTKSEKVSTELKSSDLTNYYDHPDDYPHVFAWFDQRLTRHGHISHGAGQIRSFGRLAFFRYYDDIVKALREKRTEIVSALTQNEALHNYNISLDSANLDVWLVFSVAGGTGSGMFLDMAFALRHQFPNVRVRAIIVLPDVFSNDFSDRIYGNAYAALMELEHYNYGKDQAKSERGTDLHRYQVAWTRDLYREGERTLLGPVFDTAYIIGNRPAGGSGALALEDKDALCRMLAEWIYVEYATGREVESLVAERRSAETNFLNALNGITSHPYLSNGLSFTETFSRRYSSLGLSKLYIPVNRVEAVVQYQLAKEFIDIWTKDIQPGPGLDDLLTRDYLHRVGIDSSNQHRDFIRAMETDSQSGGRLTQRLQQQIWSKRTQFLTNANDLGVHARINQWLENELMIGLLDASNPVRERRGNFSKLILQSADEHYKTVTQNLHQLVTEILSQPEQRFEVAREALRRMRDRLIKDKERYEKAREKNLAEGNRLTKEAQTRLQWLEDTRHGFTRKTIIEVALELIETRVTRELMAQVLSSAANLTERLLDYIGRGRKERNAQGEEVIVETGLIKQLTDFQRRLQTEVKSVLNERLQAFQKLEPSPIYIDMGEGAKEVERFYVDRNNQPIVEQTLFDWERRFFEDQAPDGPQNLWAVREALANEGPKKLIDRLLRFARTTLQHLEQKNVNVIERLTEKYKPESNQYSALLGRLLGYGQPWLAEPDHFVDRDNTLADLVRADWLAQYLLNGVESSEKFNAELRKRSGNKLKLVNTSPDRVYVMSEIAGFPLMVIPGLDRYRNDAYYAKLEEGEVLHTDLAFEKFQDLLIMEKAEVESYVRALQIFLQGLLLSVIECTQSGASYAGALLRYSFINRDGLFEKPIDLGPFSVAVRRLARRAEKDLLDLIVRDVTVRINNQDDQARTRWYALLYFHAESGDSYFNQFPQDHVVRAVFRQEASKIREESGSNLDQQAKTEIINLKDWTVERPPGTGLHVLDSNPM
jgi:hypothetical protein